MSDTYIALYTNIDQTSPFSQRVEIALAETGIRPTIGLVDLKNKPEWFTTLVNPFTKEIPTIAYGGPVVPADQPSSESVKLTESRVILEFLADIYPSAKLLPADPVQRAKARFFIERAQSTITASWIAFHKDQGTKEALLDAFETFQSLLPETGFAVGDWSIADACVAPGIGRLEVILREDLGSWEKGVGLELHKELFGGQRFPRFVRYLRDLQARNSWKSTWDETRFVEYRRKRFP
ncbi:unnamed protein product [Peniophora sp. CBMAI 1063]|nr:unnamed protein product [Peniophora sp. CBMAI 1063]